MITTDPRILKTLAREADKLAWQAEDTAAVIRHPVRGEHADPDTAARLDRAAALLRDVARLLTKEAP